MTTRVSHSTIYARADGVTHEQLLERRKEQDTRKIVLYLTWPPQFKSSQPKELKQAKEATMAKVQALFEGHAEDVAFGECKDDQGNVLLFRSMQRLSRE